MGRLCDGRAFLHRALVLSSLLLLASGEIFFEERFDGTVRGCAGLISFPI